MTDVGEETIVLFALDLLEILEDLSNFILSLQEYNSSKFMFPRIVY